MGLTTNVLQPVPEYSMNPFYWLGALTVIAFTLQVLTGLLMLLYYVPTTDQAYSSTLYIIKYVPLGWLIETVHLYGGYSMILLAFLHMFRGYFASVHKKPREMMWVVGMLMGLITLGFGLTGYLLPWTVVSKSATDVSIGMLSFLPSLIAPIVTFLVAGTGSNAAELTRFFDLHVVVLPAGLLALLAAKLYMFEAHGPAGSSTEAKESKVLPWFPNVFLYLAMIGSAFIAMIIMASAMFPRSLPPEFTPQAASNYVPQPEWYFLWIYQVLKFASFEGSGIYYALGSVTIIVVGIVLLPFIDRSPERNPLSRPLFVTVGLVLIAELVALTVWGYFTPGQVIPDSQALVITVGIALVIVVISALTYRTRSKMRSVTVKSLALVMALPFTHRMTTGLFLIPLVVGSVSLANLVGSFNDGHLDLVVVASNLTLLLFSFFVMAAIIREVTLAQRRTLS